MSSQLFGAWGILYAVLVHRLDRVLARTDPFDLAQALERYVHALSAERIQSLVIDAASRMGAYYRAEFVRLLQEDYSGPRTAAQELDDRRFAQIVRESHGDEAFQRALARLLKSNLRAIPIFGPAFTAAILQYVPADRAVAIGEESRSGNTRAALIGGIAVALVLAGAVGEHVISNARAQSSASSAPQSAAIPAETYVTPSPPPPANAHALVVAQPQERPAAKPVAPSAPQSTSPAVSTSAPAPVAAPFSARPFVAFTKPPVARSAQRTPPPAAGVATIAVPAATPTPQPTSLDVSDMPDAYTDATPLPAETAAPVAVPHKIALKTPTPKPRKSWLKRQLKHVIDDVDPFQPHP